MGKNRIVLDDETFIEEEPEAAEALLAFVETCTEDVIFMGDDTRLADFIVLDELLEERAIRKLMEEFDLNRTDAKYCLHLTLPDLLKGIRQKKPGWPAKEAH